MPAKKKTAKKKTAKKKTGRMGTGRAPLKPDSDGVIRLSGGNPQIAKGEGDEPVRAYIAAMPGWKRKIGERVDAVVVKALPGVRKCVRWNSPFYGTEKNGWFLSMHVFEKFVKVTFFNGRSLTPLPPGGTPKSQETRWIDVREGELDEKQLAAWVKQAARIPGWAF